MSSPLNEKLYCVWQMVFQQQSFRGSLRRRHWALLFPHQWLLWTLLSDFSFYFWILGSLTKNVSQNIPKVYDVSPCQCCGNTSNSSQGNWSALPLKYADRSSICTACKDIQLEDAIFWCIGENENVYFQQIENKQKKKKCQSTNTTDLSGQLTPINISLAPFLGRAVPSPKSSIMCWLIWWPTISPVLWA